MFLDKIRGPFFNSFNPRNYWQMCHVQLLPYNERSSERANPFAAWTMPGRADLNSWVKKMSDLTASNFELDSTWSHCSDGSSVYPRGGMCRQYGSLNAWFMMVYDMYYFYIKRAGFLLYVHEEPTSALHGLGDFVFFHPSPALSTPRDKHKTFWQILDRYIGF